MILQKEIIPLVPKFMKRQELITSIRDDKEINEK